MCLAPAFYRQVNDRIFFDIFQSKCTKVLFLNVSFLKGAGRQSWKVEPTICFLEKCSIRWPSYSCQGHAKVVHLMLLLRLQCTTGNNRRPSYLAKNQKNPVTFSLTDVVFNFLGHNVLGCRTTQVVFLKYKIHNIINFCRALLVHIVSFWPSSVCSQAKCRGGWFCRCQLCEFAWTAKFSCHAADSRLWQ